MLVIAALRHTGCRCFGREIKRRECSRPLPLVERRRAGKVQALDLRQGTSMSTQDSEDGTEEGPDSNAGQS
jgi:hypothetical protein